MTIRNTYAAEAWDKVYSAFQQINFTSYDYDTVKESLLQYLKIYHAEHFNDFIESSELVAILELFSYVAEILAYRIDTMSHENFITTAQRKQSILRLARLISYRASRNIPARGLVKINTVRTSEDVFDSLGNNLANTTITWNDTNNTNWKEQFFLVMNRSLTTKFGQPSKSFQIGDVLMQQYTFNNTLTSFRNGIYPFNASSTAEQVQMEAVATDVDENGPFERAPDLNAQFNILYATDGKGDGSDYTGFLMFVKQGNLIRTDYTILEATANRRIELDVINVNDTDIWIYRVDDAATITENWKRVETLNEQNLYFNDDLSGRKKFEVETLENDRIAIQFGDGNFSDAPIGDFQLWTRVSLNQNVNVPKNRISGQPMSFQYVNRTNNTFSFGLTFSLTSALQNNSPSETIEHIRQAAPATYYAQNRMVNGQDYNTFMLKDPTILRLKTVNRTFAGQPKYIEWNDASRKYENTKMFGDDLIMYQDVSSDMIESTSSARTLVDTEIESLLQTNALLNTLTHALASTPESQGIISYPRRKFIEDTRTIYFTLDNQPVDPYGKKLDGTSVQSGDGSLNEKTAIQSALDQHWYGEPSDYVTIGGVRHAVITEPNELTNPDDGKLYNSDIARTIDRVTTYQGGVSGIQSVPSYQFFGLRFNRFLRCFGNGELILNTQYLQTPIEIDGLKEVITIEMTSDSSTFTVTSNLRGKLPNYSLTANSAWSQQTGEIVPVDFTISQGSTEFSAGDAFVIDITGFGSLRKAQIRTFGVNLQPKVNLNGWWEIIPSDVILAAQSSGGAGLFQNGVNDGPDLLQQMTFEADDQSRSWIFLVARDGALGSVRSWKIYHRSMKIVAQSSTTKFWYNQDTQIIDPETKKTVYDKIRILRSNIDENGRPLLRAHIYDTVGFIYDDSGSINFNKLEILPSDATGVSQSGDTVPDNVLQFESFSTDSFEYGVYENDSDGNKVIRWLTCGEYTYSGYDDTAYDSMEYDSTLIKFGSYRYEFTFGNFVGTGLTDSSIAPVLVRRKRTPSVVTRSGECNVSAGLDFMWQHFSPLTNLIDPSVTNIHDAFILTQGYYTNIVDYIKGFSSLEPAAPTPFDLRTSYGYLLKNKMLSDTVVFHPGKIKLLFGTKADQRLRAKFKVVKSPTASFSDERIKTEIISVIDTFFDIQNWDFGDKFYATELISLIHQRLATQISSVVIVPVYSVNSFGSLFTIDSGFDEVLQSAATINDIEIVDALTPSVIRQVR